MKVAVYPGSFDPITKGHLDIIKRASKIFDKVIVLVSVNPNKSAQCFTGAERASMIATTCNGMGNVVVDYHSGLLSKYLEKNNIKIIIKGLRAVSDFEYEFQMALANKKLYNDAETMFLVSAPEHMFLSSSMVKQVFNLYGDVSEFIPNEFVLKMLEEKRKIKSI